MKTKIFSLLFLASLSVNCFAKSTSDVFYISHDRNEEDNIEALRIGVMQKDKVTNFAFKAAVLVTRDKYFSSLIHNDNSLKSNFPNESGQFESIHNDDGYSDYAVSLELGGQYDFNNETFLTPYIGLSLFTDAFWTYFALEAGCAECFDEDVRMHLGATAEVGIDLRFTKHFAVIAYHREVMYIANGGRDYSSDGLSLNLLF